MQSDEERNNRLISEILARKRRSEILNDIKKSKMEFDKCYELLRKHYETKKIANDAKYDPPFLKELIYENSVKCDRLYNHIRDCQNELIKLDSLNKEELS